MSTKTDSNNEAGYIIIFLVNIKIDLNNEALLICVNMEDGLLTCVSLS